MRVKKFFYMAGMLLLAACVGENSQEQHAGGMLPADAVPVTLSYQMVPAAQTRAAALTTLNQDYIESGKSVAVLIRNHGVGDYTSYTYITGSDGALNDPDPVPYYPTDGSTHIDILGYYPASAGSSFTVQTDQTTSAAYMASDLMWATPLVDRALTTDRQTLTFSHLLSKLIVHATAGSGISKIIGVALLQVKPRVSFNNTNGSIGAAQNDATTNNPVNIQMVSDNNTASVFGACVIPPQTITGHLLQITARDASGHNGVATYRVPSGKTFAAGNFYQLDLTVSARDLGATTAITAWASTSSATVGAGSGTLTIADIPAQTYTGSALTPGVTVSYQGTALTASQYDVQYGSNINAGTAYVGVSGKGQYAGVQGFKSFIINKANSSMSNGSGAVSFTSSQNVNTEISRTISCNGCSVSGYTTSGSGFSVSRSGNTLTVTRTSSDAFSGTITVTGSGDSNHNAPSSISISVSGENFYNFSSVTSSDVGKVLCSNGHIHNKVSDVTCGGVASGIIAYVGSPGSVDASSSTYKGLALALSNAYSSHTKWCSQNSARCNSDDYCTTTFSTALAMKNGINATYHLVNKTYEGTSSHTHTAANYVKNFSTARPSGASGWFLPSLGQWNLILKGLAGSYSNLASGTSNSDLRASNVNPKIKDAGGSGLSTYYYYSSTEYSSFNVWTVYMDSGRATPFSKIDDYYSEYVRAVFAF